jgi:hypothetical protein
MRRKWTEDERRVLSALYPDTDIKEICRILDRSDRSIYTQANLLGLKRSEEYMKMLLQIEAKRLREFGNETRFQPGHTTWNKGAKGYIGPNKTSFKKGNKPHNTKEVGDTRICGKDKFLLVKVADKVWIRKEILIWEEVYGKVPKGYVVRVIDPRKNKYDINNLMIITWSENMKLNTIHKYPEELKKTIRALSKLKKTIRKNAKK